MSIYQNLFSKSLPLLQRTTVINFKNAPRYFSKTGILNDGCCPPKDPSDKEVAAVKVAWCEMAKNKACYAKAIFTALFKKHPEYAALFSKFGQCPTDILNNDKFVNDHLSKNVMGTFGKFVNKLDDACGAKSMMVDLGKKHSKYCVKPKHFEQSEKVFFETIKIQMGDKLSCDGAKALEKVVKIAFKSLKKGVQGDCPSC